MKRNLYRRLQPKLLAGIITFSLILATGTNQASGTTEKYGIRGQKAPELTLDTWIDAGNSASDRPPQTMLNYRSAGTPWTVIIDREGTIVYNQFHIEVEKAVALIKALLEKG